MVTTLGINFFCEAFAWKDEGGWCVCLLDKKHFLKKIASFFLVID